MLDRVMSHGVSVSTGEDRTAGDLRTPVPRSFSLLVFMLLVLLGTSAPALAAWPPDADGGAAARGEVAALAPTTHDGWKVMQPVSDDRVYGQGATASETDTSSGSSPTNHGAVQPTAAEEAATKWTDQGSKAPAEPPQAAQVDSHNAAAIDSAAPASGSAIEPKPVQAVPPKPASPAYLAEDQPFKLKDYEEPKPAAPTPWWQTLGSFVAKLVLVLALLGGSLFAIKKAAGGKLPLVGALSRGRNMVVLESTSLGPSQAMHLVCIGGDRLLIVGAGPQGLTTLANIEDPAQVRTLLAASRGPANQGGFGQVYDMESVVQEPDGEMFRNAMRDMGKRSGWGA